MMSLYFLRTEQDKRKSEPWIYPEGEHLSTENILALECILAYWGTARSPIQLELSSFSLRSLPVHPVVSVNEVALLRTFICKWLKVLTMGASSRWFSLGFFFLILQLPSSHNVGSTFLCAYSSLLEYRQWLCMFTGQILEYRICDFTNGN